MIFWRKFLNNAVKIVIIILIIIILTVSVTFLIKSLSKDISNSSNSNNTVVNLKYDELITKYSQEHKVDKAIIYAVIDVESSFRSDVVSKAGAIGLMQIMPETFNDMLLKTGENLSENDLFVPDVNIKYGIIYLRYLYDYFNNWDLVIVSYNAGIGNVKNWIQNPDFYDGNQFLKIPFKETSGYFNKVKSKIEFYDNYFKVNSNE